MGNLAFNPRVLLICAFFILILPMLCSAADSGAKDPGMRQGVVFFCPPTEQEAIKQLELLKKDGFDLIEFASWVWTIPTPGSDLEKRATAVLDWCDRNDVAFFLMHNIQYINPDEGGGLDKGVLDPSWAFRHVTDWARVLKGHKSVMGVILGNEVGPSLGTPKEAPALWDDFRGWLLIRHGTIDNLNTAWKTDYKSFDEVVEPAAWSPGTLDVSTYSRNRFAFFYGTIFDKVFRPALGEKLYGEKMSPDPFLQGACISNTMTNWDDILSSFPLWQIKCAADSTDKPLFNSELHLYNDDLHFEPSIEQSRYRYFTSALMGEYLTASFAWDQWKKPEIAKIHSATPGILADVRRVEKECRTIADTYKNADLAVLVTEENYHRKIADTSQTVNNPMPLLYAHMGSLGRPWRFVMDDDLHSVKKGTLVVWTDKITHDCLRTMIMLPGSVKIIAIGEVPSHDEYGRDLPGWLLSDLVKRVRVVSLRDLKNVVRPQMGLPTQYQQVQNVKYLDYALDKGHYQYPIPYCTLELKRAVTPDGILIAVINNTDDTISAPLPWTSGRVVKDLVSGKQISIKEASNMSFGRRDVRLFLIQAQNQTAKKDKIMSKDPSKKVLDNIHNLITWHYGQNYLFNGCMQYLMECLHEDKEYVYWFFSGVTGDSFTQLYRPNSPEFVSCLSDDTFNYDLAKKAFDACGYDFTYVTEAELKADKAKWTKKIVEYINKDIPVITHRCEGIRSFAIICGYENNGETLLLLKDDIKTPEKTKNMMDYSKGLLFVGDKKETPPLADVFRNAVMNIPALMSMQPRDGLVFGKQAFEAWADGLLCDDSVFEGKTDAEMDDLRWRLHCALLCIAGTNGCSRGYLAKTLSLCPDMKVIPKLAPVYERMQMIFEEISNMQGGFSIPNENLKNTEMRRNISDKIREFSKCYDEIHEIMRTM
ncbi:MAG: beta-galactosidase [Armatimonadota bacterium]